MSQALPTLDALRGGGLLREVDLHFARTVERIAGIHDPLVLLGLAVASRAPGAGHVCVELDRVRQLVRLEDRGAPEAAWPDAARWRAALEACEALVATPSSIDADSRPLVLDGARLYLQRYWRYQQRLVSALAARARIDAQNVDEALLVQGLDRLFPRTGPAAAPDMQRVAACIAVLRGLTVITGGPGTGKTTTVVKVLALLLEQARAAGARPLRIALAAPTGKAAARMVDAIADGASRLEVDDEIRARIPDRAFTLHRLLGVDYRHPTRFRHDAANPLPMDVVVVDEVSMVDLALMAKLVDAVPPSARLVLLGDRDQLASVEAGAILGDICADGAPGMSPALAARVRALSGEEPPAEASKDTAPTRMQDSVVRLTRSHRFAAEGGIGALARAINAGDADAALALLVRHEPAGERYDRRRADVVSLLTLPAGARDLSAAREQVVEGYRELLERAGSAEVRDVLDALDRFRVLCAHRGGPFGVAALNDAITGWLQRAKLLPPEAAAGAAWYHGRPIIVTENDYDLELFNGDTGIVLDDGGRARAFFRRPDGDGVRAIAPARLPAHETVLAMTVHKSQGSEFREVLLVLPAEPSPILTRELLYTGITRARDSVLVVGSPHVLRAAVAERVQRASGLRERLWGAVSPPSEAPSGAEGAAAARARVP